MNRFLSKFALFAVMFLSISAVSAFAQEEGTLIIHLSQPTAVPGHVLAPGNYKLSLVESVNGARQVKVLDANGKFLSLVPIHRAAHLNATDDSVVKTLTDQAGLSRIDSFYFPAAEDGFQFSYSKSDLQKADLMAQQILKNGAVNGQ